MKTVQLQDFRISVDCIGPKTYTKVSYPRRYGLTSEIAYSDFLYQFNLNGELKYISSTGPDWPHPAEWLKRTIGNDWVYYSTGSYYSGVFDLFGEYYLPCPKYPTNTLFKEDPFTRKAKVSALREFEQLVSRIPDLADMKVGWEIRNFLNQAGRNSMENLQRRADAFHQLLKARISVLPPDCRHVDYDVIPVMVADGCLYNCSFCEVKSGMELSCRTRDEITAQLNGLREFLGNDLVNYNSVYLGQHDTLAAEPDDIIFAAEEAYGILQVEHSYMNDPKLFLFGSGETFLNMTKEFWDRLNELPYYTYINIGLESFDENTLKYLKKPVSAAEIVKAFQQMLIINRKYDRLEITANFVLGGELPAGHYTTLLAHLGENLGKHQAKGCIYMSPLKGSKNTREPLGLFREIKQRSRMDTFLYLIQRL